MVDKPVVFISYAHNDLEGVRKIYTRLKEAGLQPWIDEDDIRPGQKWLDAIREAIRKADFFLLCLSPQSISRRGVLQNEIRSALEVRREKLTQDIWFLPAWIQVGAPFPKQEMEELPEELRSVQWANLGDPSGWSKLLEAIRFQLGKIDRANQVSSVHSDTAAGDSLLKVAELQVNELRVALKAQDSTGADVACQRLEAVLDGHDGALPDKVLRPSLLQLSKQRWVALAGRLADACIRSGASRPYVRRYYAEALLRSGFHSAAVETLTAARTDAADDPTEWREVTLGLAMAYAGRYRKSSPARATHAHSWITTAIALCEEVYRKDQRRNPLHGTAAAALTARASADGIRVGGSSRPAELAETVLDELVERQEIGSFLVPDDCAAGLVASLVSGDHNAGQLWLRQFLEHPETSPADIERLSELIDSAWREEHTDVVAELRHHLLRRDMEPEIVVPQPAPSDQLEAVFGQQRFVTPFWFKHGIEAAESVACIRHDDDAIATSFVLRGGDLRPEWGDDLVLLSNSYVITADPAVREQLAFSVPPVESLRVQFTAHGASNNREHRIAELMFSSPPDQLDVTVCRLDPPVVGVKPLHLAKALPSPSSPVYLIGHPGGGSLQLSTGGNLIDSDGDRLHYTTPSEAGSSGSPVLNRDWKVIGIHHAGSLQLPRLHRQPGSYAANEGISMLAILRTLRLS